MSSRGITAETEILIGERIRSRRIQAGVSQENLGKALGVTFQQVQKYEKGANRVSAGRLLMISEVLECDVMDFYVGLTGDRPSYTAGLSKLMSTADGIALVDAMQRIRDPQMRRTVVDIAQKLAQWQPPEKPAIVQQPEQDAAADPESAPHPESPPADVIREPPVEVVRDPLVMEGEPVVAGTNVLAETILSYLRSDHTSDEIFRAHPELPFDAVEAVVRWAETTYGPDWKTRT